MAKHVRVTEHDGTIPYQTTIEYLEKGTVVKRESTTEALGNIVEMLSEQGYDVHYQDVSGEYYRRQPATIQPYIPR
jgi:hypothetical protein